MAADDTVLFELDEGVGIVTLNRPKRHNAVTWDMAEKLVDRFRELQMNDEVKVIVLTGAGGRAFCAGGDVEWIGGEADRPIPGLSDKPIPRYQRKTPAGPYAEFTRMIVAVDKPVIAAIPGIAVGAGLAFALACDRRFADTTTRMAAIFVTRGLSPDSGITYFLPRIVGLPKALKMVETGEMLDAEAAKEAGLIDELVPEGEALSAALDYAKALSQGASVAIDFGRRFIHKSLNSTLDEMLDYEAVASVVNIFTEDAQEGTKSFMEKREPKFKGQ